MSTEFAASKDDVALRETLELRLLETAARYLYANLFPLPLLMPGLAVLLSPWSSTRALTLWVVGALAAWSLTGLTIRSFLRDENRLERRHVWTMRIASSLFLASCTLVSVALFFWADGARNNNILLYVFVAAGMASAAGQSAPCRALAIANLLPYCAVLLLLSLLHEAYPMNVGFSVLLALYIGIIAMYARAVFQLAYEMLHLREEKRTLIGRLERALAEATEARQSAETASRAKSQFLANMSHELRTPLNAVLGFAEVIRDRLFGDNAGARYSDYAGNIHASGTHLLGLINDVLDLSKIEAGKWELHPERYDLAADAADALRLVEPQAARKSVRLARDVPAVLEICADKRALRQVTVNLLANAVKFTPAGGVVTLSARRLDDGSVTLSVTDTGVGIRPEDMQRVLETFGQGRHDISPGDEHGTGLGLAIAKRLIEAHGGTIALASELGEGTVVTVVLPQNAIELAA